MASDKLVLGKECSARRASTVRSPVSGINAHLRLIPRDPGDFWVVVPFHHADGLLCEAELNPLEAAGLSSEIIRVIDQGNSRAPHLATNEKQEIYGV